MIRTVVSDLGKVILWFDNTIFLGKLAAHGSLSLETARAIAHDNLDLLRLFDLGAITPGEFWERVSRALGVEIGDDLFWEYYNDIFWPNPPVLDILRKAKAAGHTLVLLSNTDVMRFTFIRSRFPEILIFDAYVPSYEVKVMKPDPAIYLEAARRAGSKPEECVFIDDLQENVDGALAAGMSGVRYEPEIDLEAELRKLGLAL